MKSIGLLASKKTNILFLLPEDIKKNISHGIDIFVVENYGKKLGISDQEYSKVGCKIVKKEEILKKCDILLKVECFTKKELKIASNKTIITLVNFLNNVKMLEYCLYYNISSFQWICLFDSKQKKYSLFNELQVVKNNYVLETLAKMKNEIINVENILIFNHSSYACKLAQELLKNNYNVTIVANVSYPINVEKEIIEATTNLAKEKKLKFDVIKYDVEKMSSWLSCYQCIISLPIKPGIKSSWNIVSDNTLKCKKKSLFIDLSAENGISFIFAKTTTKFNHPKKINKCFYLVPPNINDLYPKLSSEIISKWTTCNLNDFIDEKKCLIYANLCITNDKKIVNAYIKEKFNI